MTVVFDKDLYSESAVRQAILDYAEIAENGFPQDMVDGVMTSLSIDLLLTREAADVGVEAVIPNFAYCYATSGNPWNYMDYVDALGMMDEWNQQGLYADIVAEFLAVFVTVLLIAVIRTVKETDSN